MSEPRINEAARQRLDEMVERWQWLADDWRATGKRSGVESATRAGDVYAIAAADLRAVLVRCTGDSEPQADRAALEKLRERLDAEAVKYKTPGDHSTYDDYQQGRSAMADEACVELERIMLVAEGREPRCAQCGGSVEEMRHGWATPTCFGCLPESEDRPW